MMKKQFLNLGKALNIAEQKSINGGGYQDKSCITASDCYDLTVEHDGEYEVQWGCVRQICVQQGISY